MLRRPVRLDMNEAPFPPAPHVVAAARKGLSRLNRYAAPEDLARLRHLLADYAAVESDQIVLGPGSDILLREMIHAFAGPRKVVMLSPSFLPTLQVARERAGSWTGLRLSPPNFSLQPELLLAQAKEPCLVIIDNPNNPTGQVVLDRKTISKLLESRDVLVVVDEAYHEFARTDEASDERNGSVVDLVKYYANLAVTRTMDKAFCLAGARIGYAVAGETLRRAFSSFYPFLPQPSLHAALAALERPAYVEDRVTQLIRERERVYDALRDLGAEVNRSRTNFLLVRSGVPDVAVRLRDEGVLVSDVSNQLPSGFIRVSVGTRQENDAFLAAFERATGKGKETDTTQR